MALTVPRATRLRVGKRVFDVIVAALMVGLLSPVLITVWLLIRATSPGGAVFQQVRLGRYGRPFVMYKFRTMFVDCPDDIHRDYVRKHPVATKRVLRAFIKATDLCVTQPERVAQRIVDAGFTPRYDYALQTLKEISYAKWREYDPEDTIRFYSLRLREAGLIKATPNKILAEGTDWRFFNELKRELRA